MMKPLRTAALAAVLAGSLATSLQARADTVLELFTSQSCSSCPPADALLGELASQPGVLALALHVDYWDRLGWKDPYSSAAYTARQRHYAALLNDDSIYTPELVVDGRSGVVGSDRPAVASVIATAKAQPQVALRVSRSAAGIVVDAPSGPGPATLMLAGYDPHHITRVGGGENGGRTLEETNIVRALAPAGTWTGAATQFTLAKPAGERAAVFLQRADGRIIGAAILPN